MKIHRIPLKLQSICQWSSGEQYLTNLIIKGKEEDLNPPTPSTRESNPVEKDHPMKEYSATNHSKG
jgi:hypothetical protein